SIVALALHHGTHAELDAVPPELRRRENLSGVIDALAYLHQPPPGANIDQVRAAETAAHRALALNELFTFQFALARERARLRTRAGAALNGQARLTAALKTSLPFALTASQLRVIEQISAELAGPSQMNRLLIGDVGSGKTLVAFHAALRAVESGWQAAIMAPTELLAEQHFANFNQ